ncbi:hypothetical protein FQN53_002336 [Emmonsiellopsis sp. PD_33]|nr:hypothetical protein FQN53_002336 [Emmonsiellopsis sp. PD_33]
MFHLVHPFVLDRAKIDRHGSPELGIACVPFHKPTPTGIVDDRKARYPHTSHGLGSACFRYAICALAVLYHAVGTDVTPDLLANRYHHASEESMHANCCTRASSIRSGQNPPVYGFSALCSAEATGSTKRFCPLSALDRFRFLAVRDETRLELAIDISLNIVRKRRDHASSNTRCPLSLKVLKVLKIASRP